MNIQQTRNASASLEPLARRLRKARQITDNPQEVHAYEMALKMVIQEFCLESNFHYWYFGEK